MPYRLSIELAPFPLPVGLSAYAMGNVGNEWVLLSGRTYGLHGFDDDSFPIVSQNTSVFVLNLDTGVTVSRSLLDPSSGLNQEEIDQLSVTNALYFQQNGSNTLYFAGGYGIKYCKRNL